ncbi:MAG: CotH kinase family protein [Lachnospiraceae bacterium]|nr:CotH kinase family protein [Lachnospiraceae bacterium]
MIGGRMLSYYDLLRIGAAILAVIVLAAGIHALVQSLRERRLILPWTGRWSYALLAGVFVFGAGIALMSHAESEIRLNEVSRNEARYLFRHEAYASDYIEICNLGHFTNLLSGYYLSDDEDDLKKLPLSGYAIEPGGFYVFPFGGVPFGISGKGETIYLSNEQGKILDRVAFPAIPKGHAYARETDGVGDWVETAQTPGVSNQSAAPAPTLQEPVFSAESGFYRKAFELMMQAQEGEEIFYTTDGSVPDRDSLRYEGPITVEDRSGEPNRWRSVRQVVPDWKNYEPDETPVKKATIIRAVAVKEDGAVSPVRTESFWVGDADLEKGTVVSLVADPEDLFGEDGIYVTGKAYDEWYQREDPAETAPLPNFQQEGRAWEILARFSVFEDGEPVLDEPAGLRIQGSSTREDAQKRFSVFARKEYGGDDSFSADLFGDGIGTHAVMTKACFFDAIVPRLVGSRDVAGQKARPVSVFLNGEFWYDTFLLEKYNEEMIAARYGIPEGDVILLKGGEEDTNREFPDPLYDWLSEHDLENADNYAELGRMIDIQSYIDFWCTNIYIANMDVSEAWNVYYWKSADGGGDGYADGRWRWGLFDLDYAGYVGDTGADPVQINTFRQKMPYVLSLPLDERPLWKALIRSPLFREQFVSSFTEIMKSCFTEEMYAAATADTDADWEREINYLRQRREPVIRDLAAEFGLSEEVIRTAVQTDEKE